MGIVTLGEERKASMLFVGGEPDAIQALDAALRQAWLVGSVDRAEQAATRLREGPFDLVISPLATEFEDGVSIWDWLAREFPNVVRISLVDSADDQRAARFFGRVHQQLATPLDPTALNFAVDRAVLVQSFVEDRSLQGVLSGIDVLPMLPLVYRKILQELRSDDPSLHRIGELVAQDVAICARVLQIANSALYGLHNKVSDPVRATVHIGLGSAKAIALTMGLIAEFEQPTLPAGFLEELVDHSLNVGIFAKAIGHAEGLDEDSCDNALTAGLLHDLGRLVLASKLPQPFQAARNLQQRTGCCMYEAEREIIGTSHAELGAYLIGLWGLPDALLFAVLEHHTPAQAHCQGFNPVLAVHLADQIHHNLRAGLPAETPGNVDMQELARLELEHLLPTWGEICTAVQLV